MQYDPKPAMKASSWDNETETTKANNSAKKGLTLFNDGCHVLKLKENEDHKCFAI